LNGILDRNTTVDARHPNTPVFQIFNLLVIALGVILVVASPTSLIIVILLMFQKSCTTWDEKKKRRKIMGFQHRLAGFQPSTVVGGGFFYISRIFLQGPQWRFSQCMIEAQAQQVEMGKKRGAGHPLGPSKNDKKY